MKRWREAPPPIGALGKCLCPAGEGASSSPFAGQSDAECALVMIADAETHAGLPL